MCFHCENRREDLHIETEARQVFRYTEGGQTTLTCLHCMHHLTEAQAIGASPHLCNGTYVMIGDPDAVREISLEELISNWKSHPLTMTVTVKTGEIKFYLKGKEWKKP